LPCFTTNLPDRGASYARKSKQLRPFYLFPVTCLWNMQFSVPHNFPTVLFFDCLETRLVNGIFKLSNPGRLHSDKSFSTSRFGYPPRSPQFCGFSCEERELVRKTKPHVERKDTTTLPTAWPSQSLFLRKAFCP